MNTIGKQSKFVQIVDSLFKRRPSKKDTFIMKDVAEYFNNPQEHYKVVHVAGTNGKGSVWAKVATLLEKSGVRTGLFVSPHVSTVRERIQVNRKKITQEDFVKYYEKVEKCENELNINLSFFQYVLAMSVVYFKDTEWDYVVMEWGIGGTHSQTNFLDSDYAVITSIGLDHWNVLGETEEEILIDKAGIIRNNAPWIVGPEVNIDILQPIIDRHNAKLVKIEKEESKWFVHYNKSISRAVYNEILENDPKIVNKLTEDEIEQWLNVNPPCRLQRVDRETIEKFCPEFEYYPRSVVLDVGHNPPAMSNLIKALETLETEKFTLYVIAWFSSNKDIKSAMHFLSERATGTFWLRIFHIFKDVLWILYRNQTHLIAAYSTTKTTRGQGYPRINQVRWQHVQY